MLKLGELNVVLSADDKPLKQGLDDAQDATADAGKESGSTFTERFQTAAAAGMAVVGAAIGVSLAGALELDAAQAKLTAQIGDAGFAEELGKVAGELYSEGFGQSVADNMEAVRAVLSSGLVSEDASNDAISAATRKAQALADAFGVDVVGASRAAGQMMRTGMASDANQAFDLLTRGFQQTGDLSGDLLDTVTEYSTQWRKLGLDGSAAMGLLTQGIKAGARDLDLVADAVKEFSIRAIDGSTSTAQGFQALGLDAQQMGTEIAAGGTRASAALDLTLDRLRSIKDPVVQAQTAVALFGSQAEDLGAALYALDPSTATAALGDVSGAADKMATGLHDSAGAQLEQFKRQMQSAFIEQAAQCLPYIQSMTKFLSDNQAVLVPLALVLGGLVITISAVIAAIRIWTMVTTAYTAVQAALNTVWAACPIGLVILAIASLIAGIILLWNNSAAFRNFWIGTWESIKNAASAAATWIATKWNSLTEYLSGMKNRISAATSGLWDGIKNAFRDTVNWIIGKWNNLSFTIGGGSIMGQEIPSMTLSTPNIPYLAGGGAVTRAGLAMVGERGPELLSLPTGAQVQPLARQSTTNGLMGSGNRVDGQILIRGDGILAGLREAIVVRGGNVQAVLGG